jgi:hypothetical protein
VKPILVAVLFLALPAPSIAQGQKGESRAAPSPQEERHANRPAQADDRALAYLAGEVPRWFADNRCHSCHNNGDGARALYEAIRRDRLLPPSAIQETTRWLSQPGEWDHNGGEGQFSDKRLARIQFALALTAAFEAKQAIEPATLIEAATIVAKDQSPDGAWSIDESSAVGSPATYGRPLATALARSVLVRAGSGKFDEPIRKAEGWLSQMPLETVSEASAYLISYSFRFDSSRADRTEAALSLIRRAQTEEGGWGPYVTSRPEVYDSALALLALGAFSDRPQVSAMRQRGRSFLLLRQQEDGSWVETTRPSGGESYAQRLSTTGWAALALLATPSGVTISGGQRPHPRP